MSDSFEPCEASPFGMGWRCYLRRAGWVCLALVVLLVGLELLSRWLYPERVASYLAPAEHDGQAVWVDNQFFPYRFFQARSAPAPMPVVALQKPSPQTIRICLLGAAETLGSTGPEFGLARQLERMLRHRYPDVSTEVISLGLDGANSYLLLEMARDLHRLQPQVVVVMTGNEEIVGPFGPSYLRGGLFSKPRLARPMLWLTRLRMTHLFAAISAKMFPVRSDLSVWRNPEPVTLERRLAPNDSRVRRGHRAFRRNLEAILRTASAAAPNVIVCTTPVNLSDCAPFATSYAKNEQVAQQVRETLRQAMAAEAATNLTEAARFYSEALRLHPTHAEGLYRAAGLAQREGLGVEASALYLRARDADALRLRADSRINALIRECAAVAGVSLLDVETILSTPAKAPGRDLFLDHVRFNFTGNYRVAAALLTRLEFMRVIVARPTGGIPSQRDLAAELLYDPWGQAAETAALVDEVVQAPYRWQFDNAQTLMRLCEEAQQRAARVESIPPAATANILARRLDGRGTDAWLATAAAHIMLRGGLLPQAEREAVVAMEQWPHRFDARGRVALIRAHQGQEAAEGIRLLREGRRDWGYYDITWALTIGRDLQKQKNYEAARPWLEYAHERDPWNSDILVALADTWHHLKESDAAVELLKEAVEHNPRNSYLWEELAVIYCLRGELTRANECFDKSEEIAPYRYERLLKWADALVRLHQYRRARKPIQRYLIFMPDDPVALALRDTIMSHLPQQASGAEESEANGEADEEKSPSLLDLI
jgi:tetratricopeptide (TPR) repeat protein